MYFDEPGRDNTEQTLKLAYERGVELGLTEVVIASTKGDTAYRALEIFKGFKIISVTYHCGFKEPFEKVMSTEVRKDLESKKVWVPRCGHLGHWCQRIHAKRVPLR